MRYIFIVSSRTFAVGNRKSLGKRSVLLASLFIIPITISVTKIGMTKNFNSILFPIKGIIIVAIKLTDAKTMFLIRENSVKRIFILLSNLSFSRKYRRCL